MVILKIKQGNQSLIDFLMSYNDTKYKTFIIFPLCIFAGFKLVKITN